jgi:hypothetical protein
VFGVSLQDEADSQSRFPFPPISESGLQSLYNSIKSQSSMEESDVENIMAASDYQVSALEQSMLPFRGDLNYHILEFKRP